MTNQELLSGWLKMSGKNKEIGWPQFVGRMVEIFGMEGPFSNQPMWVFLRTKSPFERRKCSKNSTFDPGHKGRNPMTLGTDLWYGVKKITIFLFLSNVKWMGGGEFWKIGPFQMRWWFWFERLFARLEYFQQGKFTTDGGDRKQLKLQTSSRSFRGDGWGMALWVQQVGAQNQWWHNTVWKCGLWR